MPNSTSQQEVTIGQRERAFNLQKQICVEITRGLAHLNRQLQLADPVQKLRIGKQISAAEVRLNDAKERFENAAAELREAYSWRGGTAPSIDVRIDIETKAVVFEEQTELARQFELESALRKVQEDAIPFATKLAVTTAYATALVLKEHPESVIAPPVTLSEKLFECEQNINRTKSELDYLIEQLRPWRLVRTSSRLGELRSAQSAEVQFAEEELAKKLTTLSELVRRHKDLLAESQRVQGTSMARRLPEINPPV
jgi:hypothetical protein